MKKRVISAAIMIAIIVPLVIIGKVPFIILVGLVAVLAYKELSDLYNFPLVVKLLGAIGLLSLVYNNFDANNNPIKHVRTITKIENNVEISKSSNASLVL